VKWREEWKGWETRERENDIEETEARFAES